MICEKCGRNLTKSETKKAQKIVVGRMMRGDPFGRDGGIKPLCWMCEVESKGD